jgi:hypothetical protein
VTDVKPARKRWSYRAEQRVEVPRIDAFLDEIVAVCKRHGFGLSHEDKHGGFAVVTYDAFDIDWLCDAADDTGQEVAS